MIEQQKNKDYYRGFKCKYKFIKEAMRIFPPWFGKDWAPAWTLASKIRFCFQFLIPNRSDPQAKIHLVIKVLRRKWARLFCKAKINLQVVWVTGASTGIGEALAMEAVKHGAKVVITARWLLSSDKNKYHQRTSKILGKGGPCNP